jgi:SAM-dependent methyltransferase
MTQCPVCLETRNHVVLTRDRVPVLQNVIVRTEEEARRFPVARLKICRCHGCDFVWNADFDPAAIQYDSSYNNSVQASAVYRAHLAAMARRVLDRPGTFNCVDIGCGEAEFLAELTASGRVGKAIGFDPAFKGSRPLDSRISVRAVYFDDATARDLPDDIQVVCSRHTIEHIPAPRPFIASIAAYVKSRHLPLYLETPDVEWIFRNNAFEDFFYEHCSLFSPRSMKILLRAFGLDCRVESVFGGQYMWIEAWPAPGAGGEPTSSAAVQPGSEALVADAGIGEALGFWEKRLAELSREGPVAIWGAASKGVTFSLLVNGVDFGIDLNPAKQGCFMPVTATPIVSPEEALRRGVRSIVVMNPNYLGEIAAQLKLLNWNGNLLTLQTEAT